MLKPFYFATPSLDRLKFHCWGDVNNYKKDTNVSLIQGIMKGDNEYEISYLKAWIEK